MSTTESSAPTSIDPAEAEIWFRQLFADTYASIVAYARRRVMQPADADEVVSETYAVAWRRIDELTAVDRPLPWLYGVAGNVLRNRARASSRHLRLIDRAASQPPARTSPDPSDIVGSELRTALASLSADDQEVLRLVAWEGLSHAETATALGCSTNAVGIRMHRARQRLQDALDAGRKEPQPPGHTPDDEKRPIDD